MFRQALESPILDLATRVREGRLESWRAFDRWTKGECECFGREGKDGGPSGIDKLVDKMVSRLMEGAGDSRMAMDAAIICWTNKERHSANIAWRRRLNMPESIVDGERLLSFSSFSGVCNGDLLTAERIGTPFVASYDSLKIRKPKKPAYALADGFPAIPVYIDGFESIAEAIAGMVNTTGSRRGERFDYFDEAPDWTHDYTHLVAVDSVRNPNPRRLQDQLAFYTARSIPLLDAEYGYAMTCHKCVAPNTIVETPSGMFMIKDIGESGKIGTPNGPRDYIKKFVNPPGRMIRIETKDGYTLDVTPEHGIDVWNGEAYVRVEAAHIQPTDMVRLKLWPTFGSLPLVKMPDAPSVDVRAKEYELPGYCISELAEFLGIMVADGTVYRSGFRMAKRHEDVADRFDYLCRNLFGATPSRFFKLGAHHVEVSSTQIRKWLIEIGGMAPNNKGVPDCILRSDMAIQAAFLRGLFEDGSVHLNSASGALDHIEWFSCHAELDRTVRIMLLNFGIICGKVIGKKGERRIAIYGNNAKKFHEKIGMIAQKKRERLELDAGDETRYYVPISESEAASLEQLEDFKPWDKASIKKRGSVTRARAKKFNVDFLNERLLWHHSEVASIVELPESESMCVEVPDGHQFIQNGFSGWNSQGASISHVGIVNPSGMGDEYQRWLYTAITRASKTLSILA